MFINFSKHYKHNFINFLLYERVLSNLVGPKHYKSQFLILALTLMSTILTGFSLLILCPVNIIHLLTVLQSPVA